jgi:hypothetical protein
MINDPVAGAASVSRLRSSFYITILVVTLLAVASPILVFPVPALFDYPAHLARQFIIHDLLTQGSFSSMYELRFAVIPNLGMEAIVLPLLFLGIPVEIAGRIFLVLLIALLGTGIVRVHRALFQKASFFPLLSLAFIFNPVFLFGFANFLFGFALALHAFTWWLYARNKPVTAILPILLFWGIALFFCHLMAAVIFLGLICSYEASRALIEGQSGANSPGFFRVLMLLAVPALAMVFLYSLAPLSSAPQAIETHSVADLLKRIPGRLKALPLHLTAYSRPIDAVILLALAGITGLALWFRRLRLSWPMLLPIIGLLVIYVIVPERWAGTNYISYRIPTVVIFLGFCSADITWNKRHLFAAAVVGIVGLRTIAALSAWAKADVEYRPMLQALEALPSHSAIYTGANYKGPFEQLLRMPWAHFEAYAAIRNRLFVHGIWADPTQNWIVLKPAYLKRAALELRDNRVDRDTLPDSDMFSPVLMANYDFLLAIQPELYQKPIPPGVRTIARSGQATLFSLHDR